jgi:very-short-patch-repair endonuclease
MADKRGEVLVAIVNNPFDLALARDQHWYRIPVGSAEKWLKDRWPPMWLAFYQTKVFGSEAHSVNYYARVIDIRKVSRWQLFPDEHHPTKAHRRYYQVFLEPLEKLPRPILSRRFRRIVFIPTTWQKFANAVEINDLFDESPLEDRLWAEFKRLQIAAERQEYVSIKDRNYALDFAIYCTSGKIDVETDGDLWHANPERSGKDNFRDNDVKTVGWKVLRFNGRQIREQLQAYCLPVISENINRLDGLDEGRIVPRKVDPDAPDGTSQPTLFDDF